MSDLKCSSIAFTAAGAAPADGINTIDLTAAELAVPHSTSIPFFLGFVQFGLSATATNALVEGIRIKGGAVLGLVDPGGVSALPAGNNVTTSFFIMGSFGILPPQDGVGGALQTNVGGAGNSVRRQVCVLVLLLE